MPTKMSNAVRMGLLAMAFDAAKPYRGRRLPGRKGVTKRPMRACLNRGCEAKTDHKGGYCSSECARKSQGGSTHE